MFRSAFFLCLICLSAFSESGTSKRVVRFRANPTADNHVANVSSGGYDRYTAAPSFLKLDMQGVVIPTYEDRNTEEVLSSATSYLVNQLGHKDLYGVCTLSKEQSVSLKEAFEKGKIFEIQKWDFKETQVPPEPKMVGQIANSRCLDSNAFSILAENYPYSCKQNEGYRLDWLISRLMTPAVYERTNRIPKNPNELLSELGTGLKFTDSFLRRDYIKRSLVTQGERVIAVPLIQTPTGNQTYWGYLEQLVDVGTTFYPGIFTFDFNKEKVTTADKTVLGNPLDAAVDAIEGFMPRYNGLFDYMLYDVNAQKSLETAPGGVADFSAGLTISSKFASVKAHEGFNSVRNIVDCMTCHMEGTLSTQTDSSSKDLISSIEERGRFTDRFRELTEPVRNAYSGNEKVKDQYLPVSYFRGVMNYSFQKALAGMGVMKNGHSVPLLPDFNALYTGPLNLTQLAKELGISSIELRNRLKARTDLAARLGLNPDKLTDESKVERHAVEAHYCDILYFDSKPPVTGPTTQSPSDVNQASQSPLESIRPYPSSTRTSTTSELTDAERESAEEVNREYKRRQGGREFGDYLFRR